MRAEARAGTRPDLCIVGPSAAAHEAAAVASGGHWVFTVVEPLLAARDRADVLGRLARALRAGAAGLLIRRLRDFRSGSDIRPMSSARTP
ncbi:MAG: hypothetical protein C5B48_13600 [Candidatus Rokuibacteriota bacterium]|nr:MAG: hypothetical protein C5B48_13600 [Candidatus Rokubacteria bacterium]